MVVFGLQQLAFHSSFPYFEFFNVSSVFGARPSDLSWPQPGTSSTGLPPFRHGWTLIPASSHQSLHRLPLPSHPFFSVHLSVFHWPVSKPSFPDCLQAAARLLVPGLPLSPSPGRLVPSFAAILPEDIRERHQGHVIRGRMETEERRGETLPLIQVHLLFFWIYFPNRCLAQSVRQGRVAGRERAPSGGV